MSADLHAELHIITKFFPHDLLHFLLNDLLFWVKFIYVMALTTSKMAGNGLEIKRKTY